jgi:hypothetical protein
VGDKGGEGVAWALRVEGALLALGVDGLDGPLGLGGPRAAA